MPDITFNCPECTGRLAVDSAGEGLIVNCPRCGKAIRIPHMGRETVVTPVLRGVVHSGRISSPASSPVHQPRDQNRETLPEPTDNEVKCPHCHTALSKMPGRKTKCHACGNFMYVRTRPSDRQRVLVTKSEAEQIEQEWGEYHEAMRDVIDPHRLVKQERQVLESQLGSPIITDSAFRKILDKDLRRHLNDNNWGLYRNTKMTIAALLATESRLEDALGVYLEVMFLDLCGPMNSFPGERSFDLSFADIAPAIKATLRHLTKEADVSRVQARQIFDAVTEQYVAITPITPAKAWEEVEVALFG